MTTSLSNLVNKLSGALYNGKCTDCKSCLEYILAKNNQLIFKCLNCNKNHNKDLNKDLINRFVSTYEFCDEDINKFILLLRKGVYRYMNTWERFDEASLPNKEEFYSSLNIDEITDVDYMHAKKVFKTFNNKILMIIMIYMFKVIHYYLLMYFKNFEINLLNLIILIFYLYLD